MNFPCAGHLGAIHPITIFCAVCENGFDLYAMTQPGMPMMQAGVGLGSDDRGSCAHALDRCGSIQRRTWVDLIAIPATFCIGVSCGLPLYLFLRSKPH